MKIMLFLATLALPNVASAATTASYYASAEVNVSVASATFVGTGEDAYSYLQDSAWDDTGDSGGYTEGGGKTNSLKYIWDFAGRTYGLGYEAYGSAGPKVPFSGSGIAVYITPSLLYTNCPNGCVGKPDITLVFDFLIETFTETRTVGNSTASARADASLSIVELLDGYYPGGGNSIVAFSGAGRYSITISPGSAVGLFLNLSEGVSGSARFSPTPVPLPATALFLVVAIASLASVKRRMTHS